jgi:membrane protein implicated in regulation of membrane protease activity
MTFVFLLCATIGGTILFCQFVMTLLGLAGHSTDFDVSDGGDGFSGDFHGDVGGNFHGDAGGDFHGDAGGDMHGADMAGHHGDAGGSHHEGAADQTQESHSQGHLNTTWLFSVITFRTVVAAMTFFGLAGMAAQSAGASTPTVLIVALGAGAAAMYGVYWLMQSLYRLRSEGTVRIERAIGHEASVYLAIPAQRAGAGKIQINLQNRTMEYRAMTSGEAIPTGAKVVVVNVVATDTLEVQPVLESERTKHV